MSPEQIQGKPRLASDQYSLGIVVYEGLTGDRPFHGSFTELCTQHMFALPPPLSEKLPWLSTEVEQVVMTALAKEPKERFASTQAFANALEQSYLTGQARATAPTLLASMPVPPVPPAQELPPSSSRSTPQISSDTEIEQVVPVASPSGAAPVFADNSTPSTPEPPGIPSLPPTQLAVNPLLSSQPALVSPAPSLAGELMLTCRGHSNVVHAAAWSSDGAYIASASADSTVQVWLTS